MKFQLALKEQKIQIDDAEYTIRELSNFELGKWKDSNNKNVKLNSRGEPVGLKTNVGVEAGLISRCLLDEKNKNVPADVIENWPSSVVNPLFKMCMSINGLEDKIEDEEKNN